MIVVLAIVTSAPNRGLRINSLWPGDAIWQQKTGSILAQVMACCLTASSHYMNKCGLIISEVLSLSAEGSFTVNTQDIYL